VVLEDDENDEQVGAEGHGEERRVTGDEDDVTQFRVVQLSPPELLDGLDDHLLAEVEVERRRRGGGVHRAAGGRLGRRERCRRRRRRRRRQRRGRRRPRGAARARAAPRQRLTLQRVPQAHELHLHTNNQHYSNP